MQKIAAISLSVAFIAAACGGPSRGPERTPRPITISDGGRGKPTIEITSPKHEQVVHGGKKKQVPIEVRVRNFDLVKFDQSGKDLEKPKKGEGHIIYYRFESTTGRVPSEKGKSALAGGGKGSFTAFASAKERYVWELMPSKFYPERIYIFGVQLVNNDHTPLSPPQIAYVVANVSK